MATLAAILEKNRPRVLHHGSGFKQDELMPGYRRSGNLVRWDGYESNAYLYATTDKTQAKILGICSAIEKKFKLEKSKFDVDKRTFSLVFSGRTPTLEQIADSIKVYLYELPFTEKWQKVNNPHNNIDTEYKTSETITKLISVSEVNVLEILKPFSINLSGV